MMPPRAVNASKKRPRRKIPSRSEPRRRAGVASPSVALRPAGRRLLIITYRVGWLWPASTVHHRGAVMPLHDWTQEAGWDSVHFFWLSHLFHWVKPRLPAEYRAHVGSVPNLAVAGLTERPDVAVRHWIEGPAPAVPPPASGAPEGEREEPDVEVATLALDPHKALYVTYRGRLVAAAELVSPRNKDRPS